MKSLLVSPNDTIKIDVVIAELTDGRVVADESEEMLSELYPDQINVESFEHHEIVFRRPSFGDSVEMAGKISTNDGVSMDFNPFAIRFERMASLLKNWTLKDGDNPIPANRDSLTKLNPLVANFIGTKLDEEIGSI